MKLIFVVNCLDRGGAERMLVNLLSSSVFVQDDITVVVLQSHGDLSDEAIQTGHRVIHLGVRKSLIGFLRLLRLPVIFFQHRPDVIHSWLYQSDLVTGLSALVAGTRPVVWSIRQTNICLSYNRLMTVVCAKLCAWLSHCLPYAIITNSHASSDSHVTFGYDSSKIKVIPNGIDIRKFSPAYKKRQTMRKELGIQPDANVVGLVARFNSQKSHATFFAAAGRLAKKRHDLHFLLCGAGMEYCNTDVQAMIDSNSDASRIHLLGQRNDVVSILNALDLFMLSSSGEGWPNVVGEAMACGIPCVVTDVGDAAKIVNDTGFIVPPHDPVALADAADKFFTLSDSQRRHLSKAARRRVENLFDIRDIAIQYKAAYQEAKLAGKRF